MLPRTHGSALFTRGETQALVTATLGTKSDSQRLDFIEGEKIRKFIADLQTQVMRGGMRSGEEGCVPTPAGGTILFGGA